MESLSNIPNQDDWRKRVPTSTKMPLLLGLLVLAIFFSGFGYWAIRAPIAGAAIAPGVVIASGQNQSIDHLEGGIISEIATRNGAKVKQGDALVFLDPTQAASNRNRVEKSLVGLSASLARMVAEMDGSEEIKFPDELIERAKRNQQTQPLELQRVEFQSRLVQHKAELSVLDEQVQAIEEEMSGVKQQIKAENTKLVVLEEEIQAKATLLKRGLTPKNQYNALLRERADTEGAIGALTATIGQRKKSISEVRVRQETLIATRRSEASSQSNEIRQQIGDLEEQLTSRADVL